MSKAAADSALSRRTCLLGCVGLAAAALADRVWSADRSAAAEFAGGSPLRIAAGLRTGEWRAREVTQWYLARIQRMNGPLERFDDNGALNAFVRIFADSALSACDAVDRGRQYRNWAGVPVALKDVFDVRSQPVTVGTPAFRGYRASDDCTVWKRWRDAGAVLIGHTQCERFESGLTTPQTANPWDRRLIAGGSSGGSAAAVSAGLVPIALGAETDGSLIYPAACCAVTTLKPSHGLVSLAGVYPGLPAFDVVGPLAQSAGDCAWALATLAGEDPLDPATAAQRGQAMHWPDRSSPAARSERPFDGLRFLVATNERYSNLRTGVASAVDARVQKVFDDFLETLTGLGARIVTAEIPQALGRFGTFRTGPDPRLGGLSAHELIETVDCLAAHYPGVYRWLERATDAERTVAMRYYQGAENRLENPAFLVKAALVSAATLRIAQESRNDLRRAWDELLTRHECAAHVYLEIGSALPEREGIVETQPPAASRNGVVPCDLGWPVLSMPVGKAPGLAAPVSAQIMARRWQDHRLLAWGMEWQRRHANAAFMHPPEWR